ncbi:MAG: hypothetical protein OWS74_02890, partial [Firmicutes bacterium]|nr:hypothetical protein [Bacillota bacterium]
AIFQPNVHGETPGRRERAERVVKDPDAIGLTDFRKPKLLHYLTGHDPYATDKTPLNYYDQAHTLRERQHYIPALKQVHSQVLQDVVKRLDKAFPAFFRRGKAGEKPGYPRFKSIRRYDSFTYPQGGYVIKGAKLTLSKLGDSKIKLHRSPQGKIKTCMYGRCKKRQVLRLPVVRGGTRLASAFRSNRRD